MLECDRALVGPIPSCPPIKLCSHPNSTSGCAEVERQVEPGYIGWSIEGVPMWAVSTGCRIMAKEKREGRWKVWVGMGRFEWAFYVVLDTGPAKQDAS